MVSPWCLRPHGVTASEIRKPTGRNTQRYSTTSAYSLTSPPDQPGCPSSSRPTTLDSSFHQSRLSLLTGSLTPLIVPRGTGKASESSSVIGYHGCWKPSTTEERTIRACSPPGEDRVCGLPTAGGDGLEVTYENAG